MEIRIKRGKELVCEYSGEPTEVMVKIIHDDGGGETKWLSRTALEEALRVISAMDGGSRPTVAAAAPTMQAAAGVMLPTPAKVSAKDPPELIARFNTALAELVENPPDNSKQDGSLAEIHVRELIALHLPVFKNPVDSMYPAIAQMLGMPKERFESIVKR